MVKILDEKKQRQQEYERLKFWAEKNSEDNRKKFLHMVLMNGNELSEQHFAYECEQLDVPLQMGGYIVCCLKIDSRTYVQLSQKEWQDKIAGIIGEIGKNRRYTVYYKGQGCLYIIFSNMTEAKEDKMAASSLAQNIQIMLMQEWVCTVMAGVGFYCNTYQEIMKSRKEAEESVQDVRVSKLIREMLSYINAQYAEPDLSLKEIADKLFVNYSYLSAQFKKEMRMSASQYIVRLRMTKAADALRNGQSNMIEIACAVGYTDIKYFYRCFKKEFGITPYQYIGILQKVRESNEEV